VIDEDWYDGRGLAAVFAASDSLAPENALADLPKSLNANIVGTAGEAEESFVSRLALLEKE